MLLNDSDSLWISQVSTCSPWLWTCQWPDLRPVVLPYRRGVSVSRFGGPVGSVQANFRVLMGKEGMVTIATGLSTV